MTAIFFLLLFYGIPVLACVQICKDKNRNPLKGAIVGLIFGWFAPFGLWMMLRRRSQDGYLM